MRTFHDRLAMNIRKIHLYFKGMVKELMRR
jgi:hypothetical protein